MIGNVYSRQHLDLDGTLGGRIAEDREVWAVLSQTYIDGPYDRVVQEFASREALSDALIRSGPPYLNGKPLKFVIAKRDEPGYKIVVDQ